ncbi:MAG: hypothetical protein U0350_02500 [Caldilineaceae bacterium]
MSTVYVGLPQVGQQPEKAPQKRQSEITKENIAANRKRIKELQQQAGEIHSKLASGPNTTTNAIALQQKLTSLTQGMKALQDAISSMENRLPMEERIEQVHDRLVAEAARQEREKQAAIEQAQANQIEAAAREAYMAVPGATEQGFAQEWPSIRAQIARQAALNAAELQTEIAMVPDPVQRAAQVFLQNRYGSLTAQERKGLQYSDKVAK